MTAAFDEQFVLLQQLQEIDLSLHAFENALAALPEKLTALRTDFEAVSASLQELEQELEAVEHARRTDEQELAVSVDHLREREAKLYAIKTNKEYQAAIKEISEGKKQNREREDRILQAMEKIDALTKETTQLQAASADKKAALEKVEAEVAEEEAEIKVQMQAAMAQRPELLEKIEKETLRKYDTVRRRHPDVLVALEGGICQGCSTRVPPQLHNEILRRTEFKSCPNCQRLLYVGAAKPQTADDEAGT